MQNGISQLKEIKTSLAKKWKLGLKQNLNHQGEDEKINNKQEKEKVKRHVTLCALTQTVCELTLHGLKTSV